MNWEIYDKGFKNKRCDTYEVEYSGEFMGECSLTCSVKSPYIVDFQIGDCIRYRDEVFELNYVPTAKKTASAGASGESFVYEGIVFNSLADELLRCSFLDFVKSDNQIHYSSLSRFYFFANRVHDLAERIQVNLDRLYKDDKKWTVTVHPEYNNSKGELIDVQGLNVREALNLCFSTFKAHYIIRGRTITIGAPGIVVDNLFKYGKGNGLYEIERTAESDQQIVTRLRAYGSEKNMPPRYYANLGTTYYGTVTSVLSTAENTYIEFVLDLPYKESLFTNPYKPYYQVYAVDISLDGTTIRARVEGEKSGNTKIYSEVKNASEDPTDEPSKEKLDAFKAKLKVGSRIEFITGIEKSIFPLSHIYHPEYMPNNMAVNCLMLPGFPEETLDPYLDSKNIETLGVREYSIYFNGEEGLEEIYPSIEGMTVKRLVDSGIPVSVDPGDNGNLDELFSCEQITDSGMPNDKGGIEKETFVVTTKDVGFNPNLYWEEDNPSIMLKSGKCGSRKFVIRKCEAKGNKYELTCERVYDSSVGLFFPNKDYNINSKDKFVFLGISMPSVYVKAASQKLKEEGEKWLAKNDYVRFSYSPKVDDIQMARQHEEATMRGEPSVHDVIKEGDLMLFEDSDLQFSGNIIIDQLIIKEGQSIIPQYEVVLREEKEKGTLEKIQEQVDSIVGGSAGGVFSTQEIKSLIKLFGNEWFLRKDREDATDFLLRLLGGVEIGESVDSMLAGKGIIADTNGRMQMDRLELRSSLLVKELIVNRWFQQEGNVTYSEAGTIDKVERMDDGSYTLTIRRRWEFDVTAFDEQDVAFGSINDLAQGGGLYYDAWFRVLSVNRTANTLSVLPYPDNEVPGGKNYVPSVGMVVTRRGNATNTERQGFWYLSSYEGCICFLDGVTKPILETRNYSIIIGKLKRLELFDNLPINYLQSYVYCRGIVTQDLLRVDYEGVPVVQLNDRGNWEMAVATGENPYRVTDNAVDSVWHYGCRWRCLVDKTTDEPRYASTGWAMIEGNPNFYIDILSSGGWGIDDSQLIDGVPFTTLSVVGTLYNREVTEHLLDADVSWTRDTGNVAEDNAWAIKKADAGKSLPLMPEDLGLDFARRGVCSFKCTAVLRDGKETKIDDMVINF